MVRETNLHIILFNTPLKRGQSTRQQTNSNTIIIIIITGIGQVGLEGSRKQESKELSVAYSC
jgi:quercetin dioxygenase-like cupin family protein